MASRLSVGQIRLSVGQINQKLKKQTKFEKFAAQSHFESLSTLSGIASVRQTNSALSNRSLNFQGHGEVPKSKSFLKKIMSVSCNQPFYVKI